MDTDIRPELLQEVIATLRAHEADLRAAGIRRLSVFGCVARGDFEADSDVDLAVELDPAARMDLIKLAGLEHDLTDWLGRPVDIVTEPVEKERLRKNIDRDRRNALRLPLAGPSPSWSRTRRHSQKTTGD
jgi:predicted nucleotidyltransferase